MLYFKNCTNHWQDLKWKPGFWLPSASCYCPKSGSFQERSHLHVLQLQWQGHLLRQGSAQASEQFRLSSEFHLCSATQLCLGAQMPPQTVCQPWMWLQPVQSKVHKVLTCHDVLLSFWSFHPPQNGKSVCWKALWKDIVRHHLWIQPMVCSLSLAKGQTVGQPCTYSTRHITYKQHSFPVKRPSH